jgi:hypothetical protein
VPRRRGVILLGLVPLAFAAASSAAIVVPLFVSADGPITSLARSGLTVQANAQVPTSCTRSSASPPLAGFKLGDQVTIACEQGALVSITMGRGQPGLGSPVIPIPGLTEQLGGALPAPGPRPTKDQCAAAWSENAPFASRAAIRALRPLVVQVTAGSLGVLSAPPDSHSIAEGPTCVISFLLPGARTAQVISVWKHGTARAWRGFVDGGYRTLFIIKPGFSASANGTLRSAD